jgi:hypothetical protein
MNHVSRLRQTPALIVAMIALVAAMSGAAAALPGKEVVKKNDLARGAVTSKAIAAGAVGSKQIAGKSIKGNRLKEKAVKAKQIADKAVTAAQIADGTITSQQVADEGLSSSNIDDYAVIAGADGNLVRLTATDGASEAAARTAAPATELFKKGQFTISAKCFRDTALDETFAEIYIATAANGAIFDGEDDLGGGPAAIDFLNTDTLEVDRELDSISAAGTTAQIDESEFTAVAPDGTHLVGQTTVAAKNGNLAAGNGVYGAGNVCLFGGEIAG